MYLRAALATLICVFGGLHAEKAQASWELISEVESGGAENESVSAYAGGDSYIEADHDIVYYSSSHPTFPDLPKEVSVSSKAVIFSTQGETPQYATSNGYTNKIWKRGWHWIGGSPPDPETYSQLFVNVKYLIYTEGNSTNITTRDGGESYYNPNLLTIATASP
jgi:hypothetical protein